MKRYITVLVFTLGVIISSFAQHFNFYGAEMDGPAAEFPVNVQKVNPWITVDEVNHTFHGPHLITVTASDADFSIRGGVDSKIAEVIATVYFENQSTIDYSNYEHERQILISQLYAIHNGVKLIGKDSNTILTRNGVIEVGKIDVYSGKVGVKVIFRDRQNSKNAQLIFKSNPID